MDVEWVGQERCVKRRVDVALMLAKLKRRLRSLSSIYIYY
jgi:hypothetical protein